MLDLHKLASKTEDIVGWYVCILKNEDEDRHYFFTRFYHMNIH